MPTATLRYTLPDEQSEFDAAREGQATRSLLWDIDQHLRGIIKHGDPNRFRRELAEEIRGMIREAHGVTLE
jgi:hypothetical protein